MHAGSSTNAPDATALRPSLPPPRGTAPVNSGVAAVSPSGTPQLSCAENSKRSILATLWIDTERYTYEALCTAGAAAINVHHVPHDDDGEQKFEEEHHDALRSDGVCASDLRERRCPLADMTTTSGDPATRPSSQPPLRLVPLESMLAARRCPSSAVGASPASAAVDDSGVHTRCEEDEHQVKVMGRTLTDDSSGRGITAASSVAAQSTSSDRFSAPRRGADVRLDILEEVELCNVVPILPRTFAVEQLVQQLVPCTSVFAPQATPPSTRERALPTDLASDGADPLVSGATTQLLRADALHMPSTAGYLAQLRKVSDHHLALLRATDSPPVTTGDLTAASERNAEPFIEQSVFHAGAVPPSVPVYMHATSLAACGGSDNASSTATHAGKSSDGDLDERDEEGDVADRRGETPAAPTAAGVCQALTSRLKEWSSNVSHVRVDSTQEAEAQQGAVENRVASRRSEESPSTENGSFPTRREPKKPAVSISTSASGGASSVTAAGEASPHRALRAGGREPGHEQAARVPCDSTSLSSLMSDELEDACRRGGGDETVACTSFAAAQARYEEHRQLLLQRHKSGAELSTNCCSSGSVTAKLADGEDHPKMSAEQRSTPGAALLSPSLCAAVAPNFLADFEAAPELWSTAARVSLAPSPTRAGAAGGLTISAMTARDSEASDADMLPLSATVSQQQSGQELSLPLASPTERGLRQQPLDEIQQRQGGAVVEWSSGAVSYTADTLGLYEEQRARSQRLYHLPPPPPPSPYFPAPAAVAQPVDVARAGSSVSSAATTEDRSSLRGAALGQLQRLSRLRRAACALSHAAICGRARVVFESALSVHLCRCYRCLPLLVQFAQVPSLASPVLRRYLDVLHQTALPGLPADQQRVPPSRAKALPAKGAPGVAAAAVGARASRDRRRCCGSDNRNGRRSRVEAEVAVATTNGSEQSRKRREGSTVVVPTRPHSPQAGSSAQRLRGPADPLEVFPALQQWLRRRGEEDSPTKGLPPNGKRNMTEPDNGDGTQTQGGPAPQSVAQANISQLHQGAATSSCAPDQALPRALDVHSPPTASAGMVSAGMGSLDWVDDAVLDEVAVVGVVPRGHPHQLQLVAPSHAFCLILVQRLEEVAEAAVQILGFMTPPHPAAPLPTLAGVSRAPEAGAAALGKSFNGSTPDWRTWLEAQYFAAMWTTLQRRLTPAEWQAVLQKARDSPFLARWATAAAAEVVGSGSEDAVFGDPTPCVGIASCAVKSSEKSAAALPAAGDRKVGAAVHEALTGMRASVRSAAESHTLACLSTAEDVVARVVLTALVPILHRRITVMYELLRHFASKSLYVSHRLQCDAYQHWYSVTPSPAAVLRLLQRSQRFSGALARCFPQYRLSPVMLSSLPTLDGGSGGEPAARAAVASAESFPSRPLNGIADAAGAATDAANATAAESGVVARSLSKGEVCPVPIRDFPVTRRAASPACVTASAESGAFESPPSPPSASSPTTAATPIAATSAWMSLLPSSSDEAPLHARSQQQQPAMTYVPEAALLDPRYLQRFAWWMHRTHHGSGTNGGGAAIGISGSGTGGIGAGAPQLSRGTSTVLNIPGDYLRVLPMQEQDASIRTVLRSMAQKGRTMDLWEMSQHINSHHASYVYH
ncbi:hypothetical protein LSCM1_07887 [Leishmania martiniquensis]|uniref:Uncharacterized protein n=1 Tax=Leishmania martiniquensis TaxID=1580590 RepID=A0A836HXU4_9TRYP|nr:hypothetical protein LSCM1_07887 [Leishmania martiniquensis]